MENDDFEEWCIIESPNSCHNEYEFEKFSASSSSVNYSSSSLEDDNDFELLTKVFEVDSIKNNCSHDGYVTPINSDSLTVIENGLQLIDVDGINSGISYYVDAKNDIDDRNEELFDEEDNLEAMISLFESNENTIEDKNLDEVIPLLEFYKYQPLKTKKSINWSTSFYTETDTNDVNELDLTIFDEENLFPLEDDHLSRIQDMTQSFDCEVGPDNIDHICLEEEFNLPLMNKFFILDCMETER